MIFRQSDHFYMGVALAQAKKAFLAHEVPIGAIVIDKQGTIIARGYNQVEKRRQQTAHAEVLAIQKANKAVGNWRLNQCWLYVTVEPCRMCMGLIRLSRIEGVIYGVDSPLFGYSLDRESEFPVYKENVVKVIKGLRATEAADLLKQFFKKKRKNK